MRNVNQWIVSVALTSVTLATLATPAYAQSASGGEGPAAMDFVQSGGRDTPELVKPGAAVALSLIGTAVGYGSLLLSMDQMSDGLLRLGLLGVTFGPSLGHMYTRHYGRAGLAAGVRGAGLVSMGLGLMSSLCFNDFCEPAPAAKWLFWGGAAATLGATLYSVIDSGPSARRVNERRLRNVNVTAAPVLGPARSVGMGVALSGSF